MNINIRNEDQTVIAEITGDIVFETAPGMREKIQKNADEGHASRVILDLKGVKRIDSSGVASIVACVKDSHKANRPCLLCGLNREPRHILETTGLMKVLDVFDNQEMARAA